MEVIVYQIMHSTDVTESMKGVKGNARPVTYNEDYDEDLLDRQTLDEVDVHSNETVSPSSMSGSKFMYNNANLFW